jgi:predicted dehydrogenase
MPMRASSTAVAPVRVAVAGLGEAGATLHLPALAALPGASIVGICDPDERKRDAAATRWRVPAFDTLAEMLRSASPEVVIIATPPVTHAALCLQALGAGTHVVCEKPFVTTDAEAEAVIRAAQQAGRQVAVNHEFREMPIFRAVIDRARAGQNGRLVFAETRQFVNLPPWHDRGWRGEMTKRTLFEAGVHLVDLLMAVFGEPPRAVQASMADGGLDERGRDAIVSATFEFSSGRLGGLLQHRIAQGLPRYLELRADTEQTSWQASFGGRARLSAGLYRTRRPHLRVEYGSSGLAWEERGDRRTTIARNPAAPNMTATRCLLGHTIEAFRSGAEPPTSAARARLVLRAIDAAYASASTGRRVAIEGAR